MLLITLSYSLERLGKIRRSYVEESMLWQENTCAGVTQEQKVQLPSIRKDLHGEDCWAETSVFPEDGVQRSAALHFLHLSYSFVSHWHTNPHSPTNAVPHMTHTYLYHKLTTKNSS